VTKEAKKGRKSYRRERKEGEKGREKYFKGNRGEERVGHKTRERKGGKRGKH